MNKEETIKILSFLKASYPRWAENLQANDAKIMVEIWMDAFKEHDVGIVMAAAKAHRDTEKWPPAIAEINDKINLIKGKTNAMTGQEAWALVRKALKNGLYHAKEEYDKLPAEIQSSIGDHYALKAWAEMSLDELETVIQSQFIKSYKVKSEQKQEYDKLPSDVKAMIESTTKMIGGN